ncbi:hypothetical protein BGW80DRAFT_189913 [Lactifluus volemus]|nr:hypothetical protein BGW80DRAFT_189913 [Lactifluus volemus]
MLDCPGAGPATLAATAAIIFLTRSLLSRDSRCCHRCCPTATVPTLPRCPDTTHAAVAHHPCNPPRPTATYPLYHVRVTSGWTRLPCG